MRKIVIKIIEKISDLEYKIILLGQSTDCLLNPTNLNPLRAEIYFLNIFEIQNTDGFVLEKAYLASVLNENPLKIEILCQMVGEVNNIHILRN